MKSSKLFSKNTISLTLPLLLIVGSILPVFVLYRGFEIFWTLGLSLALFISILTTKFIAIKLTVLDIAIVIFTLYSIVHYMVLADFDFFHITFWVFLSYPVCYYMILGLMTKQQTPEQKFIPFVVILIVAVIQSFVGFLQYFNIYPSPNTLHSVIGTFYSPNALAMFLSVALLICVWRLGNYKSKKKITRFIYLALILLFSIFIIGLKARSSWYAIIFGLLALVLLHAKKLHFFKKIGGKKQVIMGLFFVCMFSVASFYAYNIKKDSANSRMFITKTALHEALKKPVFGHGVFSFKGKYNLVKSKYFNETKREWNEVKNGGYTYHAFNELVYLIFEIGLVGLLLFLFILFLLFRGFRITEYSKIALVILVMLFVFSLVSYPIYIPHIAFLGIFAAAIIRNDGNYKPIVVITQNWGSRAVQLGSVLVGFIVFFISISKIYARATMIEFHKNPELERYNDKQKIKSIFMNIDDIGESNFWLGHQLYHRENKKEGLKYMEKGFFELLDPEMGEQLAFFLYREGRYEDAEKIYKINMGNEPFRFKPKMDYVVFLGNQRRFSEQNKVLKDIIDLPVKIHSTEVENYKSNARDILKRNQRSGL